MINEKEEIYKKNSTNRPNTFEHFLRSKTLILTLKM